MARGIVSKEELIKETDEYVEFGLASLEGFFYGWTVVFGVFREKL